MLDRTRHYISGEWTASSSDREIDVINPATELVIARIADGTRRDVERAVRAARQAFPAWSTTSRDDRTVRLRRLRSIYERRLEEMAEAISQEMGAPIRLSRSAHAPSGLQEIDACIEILQKFEFERWVSEGANTDLVVYEPIGVCGLITPWNWPISQVALKVFPALACGCTVVLKPSDLAPLSSLLLAEIIDEAGFPAGVFNLVNGRGETVGADISSHPDVDMVSFTGSTRAGVAVSQSAAPTVKRVTLELGGKSPNILFSDCNLVEAVTRGIRMCFQNSGQSCNAPTRMLVERSIYDRVVRLAADEAEKIHVADPTQDGDHIGPVVSKAQFDRIQDLLGVGVAEGALIVAGGAGRPKGIDKGYFVRPTVFAGVTNTMAIAQTEVFGPVLVIIPFDDEEQAVTMANDTPYGLAAYIETRDNDRGFRVAKRILAGNVKINGKPRLKSSPFGGFKQSGNGRERGEYGFREYLEVKAISG
ncbi:aldehyde dehydrogenase family protein [Mesorhizobium sp. WSM4307]|uniref:aldehyde dehydrogenase family protein n=1 Tax=unclassified Mesorhizobium TaxID=325217 RepID=UPI000BAEE92B|nr:MULTISPECIES: aldehyde dehydrogenase family protein [unclassified Mesorhizobium]PBB24560.1 aldehyde dehydrogenase family protein [Mesorhizobium sp. WSM4304]PBB74765.1 aldehyde dehydrogenase family protein [Mesorhizobium sp. WSM4308]TRC73304.1 aldehyde dehydrogenase family protein [Mesorhizobium sp. WSM4315]TRC83583.1 aldehyde dehydrogenase family protein [Mesorhizobium sp. WSM4307]